MLKNFFLASIIFFSLVLFASANDKIVYLDINYMITLNKDKIKHLLPHREPMLLIDEL
jgi:hypothetical protein